VTIVTMIKIG